ncbi:MAG TPA: 2-oxoacid:acceptor oxidoreductase family protein [Bacillota bacterium]|nr:2-oxoacid:acceptor oxidoreductase family protein [Bacillota bacterium]
MNGIVLAGFGGQGILFAGKLLAKLAMGKDKQVTWIPSYGPEMRGGTCNCSVIIDDELIGSPLVPHPDTLFAFNLPSFKKFEPTVVSGGKVFVDSTLIDEKSTRSDISTYYIPATGIASDNELSGLANVIMLGYMMKITGMFEYAYVEDMLIHSVPKSKPQLAEYNKKALSLGYSYNG